MLFLCLNKCKITQSLTVFKLAPPLTNAFVLSVKYGYSAITLYINRIRLL